MASMKTELVTGGVRPLTIFFAGLLNFLRFFTFGYVNVNLIDVHD